MRSSISSPLQSYSNTDQVLHIADMKYLTLAEILLEELAAVSEGEQTHYILFTRTKKVWCLCPYGAFSTYFRRMRHHDKHQPSNYIYKQDRLRHR